MPVDDCGPVVREPATLGPSVSVRLLGPMRATSATGGDVLPRSRKTRALLAILALSDGVPIARREITSLLWSRRADDQARNSLRQSIHELQQRLNIAATDLVLASRSHLALDMSRCEVDVQCMLRPEAQMEQALAMLDLGALVSSGRMLLEDLVGLDDEFGKWVAKQRQMLTGSGTAIAQTALDAALNEGPARDALALGIAAARLVRLAPAQEVGWRALMQAKMDSGDLAGALRSFERCAAALARAGAGVPSSDTRDLARDIRARMETRSRDQLADTNSVVLPPTHASTGFPLGNNDIRLGVMAFRALDDPDLHEGVAALCVGLAEEITTALARFRGVLLIASSSLQALSSPRLTGNGLEADGSEERARLRALRLDFLLDGTVQRSGDRIRVTARLLDFRDPGSGNELVWSRRFDRAATDLLAMQEEIAAETAAQVDPELMLRAARRSVYSRSPLELPAATTHELFLRAIPALYRLEEHDFRVAGSYLAQAVERSPEFAAAHAWFAYWHLFLVGQGWAPEADLAMERAGQLADRAVSLDPHDARGLTIAGHARAFLGRDIDEAISLHERALELNPNLPLAWALYGLALCYSGRHEEAVRKIAQATKLSPFDPHGFFFDMALSLPLMLLGRVTESLAASRRAAAMNPALSSSYKGYLAALGLLGNTPERADTHLAIIRAQLTKLEPNFTIAAARSRSPLRRQKDLEIYLDGLRRAGLPEN